MNDIWNPWHGCHKYSEGCKYCYMYYLDSKRDKDGSYIYKVKTNFSSCEFLVEVGNITIIAKPICLEKEVKYEFMLDTQWLSSSEVTYEEIVMIKNVMDILNENKKLAISRLRKWIVEEYKEDKKQREIQSNQMLEMLKNAFYNNGK